jgi:hypothetical protein
MPKEIHEQKCSKPFPTMSVVERIIRIPAIEAVVWTYFGMPSSCPFPALQRALLYGTISDVTQHNPRMKDLGLSKLLDPRLKCFFEELARLQSLNVREYDEIEAKAVALFK